MLKKIFDTVEFNDKEKCIEKCIETIVNRHTSWEKGQIEKWKNDNHFLYYLVKRNAPFSTIIDLSGITLSSQKERNVVVNRNYLNNGFKDLNGIRDSLTMSLIYFIKYIYLLHEFYRLGWLLDKVI
jgi:hypothetical protein